MLLAGLAHMFFAVVVATTVTLLHVLDSDFALLTDTLAIKLGTHWLSTEPGFNTDIVLGYDQDNQWQWEEDSVPNPSLKKDGTPYTFIEIITGVAYRDGQRERQEEEDEENRRLRMDDVNSRIAAMKREEDRIRTEYPVPSWLEGNKPDVPEGTNLNIVNIAVVGESCSGKSTFINKLRGIDKKTAANSEIFAEVGVMETTTEARGYRWTPALHEQDQTDQAEIPEIYIWDIPGAGTESFPMSTYFRAAGMRHFDAVLVFTTHGFTEHDKDIMAHLINNDMDYVTVRTKVNMDVCNNERDKDMTESDTLDEISSNLSEVCNISEPYLIGLDRQTYDFPKLEKSLFDLAKVQYRKRSDQHQQLHNGSGSP